jgi:hypothetical protein
MSATVIARSVASTPKRSASETWAVIVGIIAPDPNHPARDELSRVSTVAASVISADAPKIDAIVVHGGGPRVRIYCLYNDDAITDGNATEDPVRQEVLGDGWKMSLPCEEDDLEWITRELKKVSTRVTARKLGDELETSTDAKSASTANASVSSNQPAVDLAEFFKS